ncbi:2Fe-2S iron-sulfur cluster-binding protein [Cyanobium sp. NS01]|uniref:2Fe-2S iron-sulfur cluster-binding protein n=1 Tax=Cyanobium sp. NS01 TaxID=261284 RepID=UPI0016458CFF|nr:2Fe-2S iron-sulfur cluster-binding protein [Cyanobium sp. NS01]QNI71588.1 2Fe-2S ferredoxin [Cyanobium sp. NS01]
MPVIRFLREERDVECYPGENLREVALREGVQLYGLKGALGNCGGCGQCITCFVEVPEGQATQALTGRTPVEDQKLKRRPGNWRLACQTLVQQSLVVITRPQVGLADKDRRQAAAMASPLPPGPTTWPEPPAASQKEAGPDPKPDAVDVAAADAADLGADRGATAGEGP